MEASSESPIGPSRAIVNSTEICEGVRPEPATVGRKRLESLPMTARKRAAGSSCSVAGAVVVLGDAIFAVLQIVCLLASIIEEVAYGAFTYLKAIPIKHLKIDIEFVRDLLENEASQHLVAATVQLVRSFGQKTVAEGVEDGETLERLRELEVDYVQGYYLGRPEIVDDD